MTFRDTAVVEIRNHDFTAKVHHVMPNELGECALLWWTDGVANEWRETHESLSSALLRLAALVRGYEMGVVGEQGWFRQVTAEGFNDQIDGIFDLMLERHSTTTTTTTTNQRSNQ